MIPLRISHWKTEIFNSASTTRVYRYIHGRENKLTTIIVKHCVTSYGTIY